MNNEDLQSLLNSSQVNQNQLKAKVIFDLYVYPVNDFKYSYSTIAFFKMKYLLFFQVEDLQEKYHECLEMLMENQVM